MRNKNDKIQIGMSYIFYDDNFKVSIELLQEL